MSEERDRQEPSRAVNYDARTGDRISANLPGWPEGARFVVAATTPSTVVLRALRPGAGPGAYAGIHHYDRLRQYGATYAKRRA